MCVVVVCVCVLDRLKNRGDDYMYNHDFIIQTNVFCNNFQKKKVTRREKKSLIDIMLGVCSYCVCLCGPL